MEAIQGLPPELAEDILDGIDRLARDPTRLSRAAALPGEQFQVYRLKCEGLYGAYRCAVLFQFSRDEETLHILDIATAQT